METALFIILGICIGVGVLYFLLNRKISSLQNNKSDATLLEWLKSTQISIDATNKTLNEALSSNSHTMVKTLQENSKQLNERLDKAAEVIRDVGKEVGQMSEIGRSMKDLQAFLKSPKIRGTIGESVLKDLITQMFPKNSFSLQFEFSSGEKVDAAIKTDGGILPIDSKFPMENFQAMNAAENDAQKITFQKDFSRDVKRHIDAIAKKYILPQEGTMDFALMYLPSESIYYEVVNMTDLMDYAKKQRVYPVSPSTLYAHLQTILLSFEGRKIESRAKEVFRLLRALQIDYDKTTETMGVLGKHLGNAQSQFSTLQSGFMTFGNKLQNASHIEEETIKKLSEN